MVVHYRWRPLHGRRVRPQYSEHRANGDVLHVEHSPGGVTVVAAWMLDPIACIGMEIGAPRVAASALADLHQLLIAFGFRRDSWGGSHVARRTVMKPAKQESLSKSHQLTIALDSARLREMCPAERKEAIALLAGLLMEAAGVPAGRSGDDRV